MKNYAFIDAQNLYLEVQKIGWSIDLKKFKIYLKEKYKIEKIFYFIGYKKENEPLYKCLKNMDIN